MKLRGLLPLMLLLGSVALAARAQVCSPESPLRRTLPVNVLDPQGNLVRGLTAADFRASFRGQPVKILSATRTIGSRRTVILFDVSPSMGASPGKFELAVEVAEEILREALAGGAFALLTFEEAPRQRIDFTPDAEAVLAAVKALRPDPSGLDASGSHTAILDALLEALPLLEPPQPGDSVYVISDGGDAASQARVEDVERALTAAGVRLFAFLPLDTVGAGVGLEMGPSVIPFVGMSGIATSGRLGGSVFFPRVVRLAQASGGTAIGVLSGGRVAPRFQMTEVERGRVLALARRFYSPAREFYQFAVELPLKVEKPSEWKLEVVDAKGKRRKDVQVVYPRKLVPCGASPPPGP